MTPDKAVDLATKMAAMLLDLVPAPVARQLIDDAAVRRANAIANAAEDLKFGLEKPELDE